MSFRGKRLMIVRHAADGMRQERPEIDPYDVLDALEGPDHDDGSTATKRKGRRTIIVRYVEREEAWLILSVSATRRWL